MTSFLYRAARENASGAARHRLDEPTGISLNMVASPQYPLPFRPARLIGDLPTRRSQLPGCANQL